MAENGSAYRSSEPTVHVLFLKKINYFQKEDEKKKGKVLAFHYSDLKIAFPSLPISTGKECTLY